MYLSVLQRGFRGLLPASRQISTTLRASHESTLKTEQEPTVSAEPAEFDDGLLETNVNPYAKPPRKCLLCRTEVELDYKNARLLQQFVSNFSGRVYDQHVTGLCDQQQERLLKTIALSRKAGYMPVLVKDPKYLKDPKLFDPLRPLRPHSFA
ncbi:unnamed protein product, partial [Mesorhabditis spiculigera]